MISFYILLKRFFLKHKGLSDERVASAIKKEYNFVQYILYTDTQNYKSQYLMNDPMQFVRVLVCLYFS